MLARAGQTEAAVDLARLAGLHPSGVISEIMNKDGTMARVPQLRHFTRRHDMPLITVADLITYRMRTESVVKCVASTKLPTEYGSSVFTPSRIRSTSKRTSLLFTATWEMVRMYSSAYTHSVLRAMFCVRLVVTVALNSIKPCVE